MHSKDAAIIDALEQEITADLSRVHFDKEKLRGEVRKALIKQVAGMAIEKIQHMIQEVSWGTEDNARAAEYRAESACNNLLRILAIRENQRLLVASTDALVKIADVSSET